MVGSEDVVGGQHHVLGGQEGRASVALWPVVQVDAEPHVGMHVLLKLVLFTIKEHTWEGGGVGGSFLIVFVCGFSSLCMRSYAHACVGGSQCV